MGSRNSGVAYMDVSADWSPRLHPGKADRRPQGPDVGLPGRDPGTGRRPGRRLQQPLRVRRRPDRLLACWAIRARTSGPTTSSGRPGRGSRSKTTISFPSGLQMDGGSRSLPTAKDAWPSTGSPVTAAEKPRGCSARPTGSTGPTSWSPDSRHLAVEVAPNRGAAADIWILSLEEGQSSEFLSTEHDVSMPAFSPDGRWIAYQSDETGRHEIYVRPFPGPGGRWQLSGPGRRGAVLVAGWIPGLLLERWEGLGRGRRRQRRGLPCRKAAGLRGESPPAVLRAELRGRSLGRAVSVLSGGGGRGGIRSGSRRRGDQLVRRAPPAPLMGR